MARRTELRRGDEGLKNIEQMVIYILIARRDISISKLKKLFETIDEKLGAMTMTLQEMLIQETFQDGWQEGLQEGRQELQKEKETIARKLLAQEMSPEKVASLTGLALGEVHALQSDAVRR